MNENEENRNEERSAEAYPLDDAAIGLLAEYDEQERKLVIAADCLNAARSAMLTLFLRQQSLTGNWEVAPNRRELVKKPVPVETPTPTPSI